MRPHRLIDRPLLFDTQAVILWATGQIPGNVVGHVNDGSYIYVSMASLWEFTLRESKISETLNYQQFLQSVRALKARILPIETEHLDTARLMPFIGSHKDPFDRLLIAQAIYEDFILVGGDRQFLGYQ